MIEHIVRGAAARPFLTFLLAAAAAVLGATALADLRRDVFPDLSAPVFNVIVQNASMGAEELETAIAIPMEVALTGLPDVRRVRSNSQLGVASTTIEFEPDADYYRSRQLVAAHFALNAQPSRTPPYGRMKEQHGFDQPLQQVDYQVPAPQMGQLMRDDRLQDVAR